MKMLNKKKRITNIVVTGIDNDTMTFPTVQETAKFLDVSCPMVYRALNENLKVRGCKVTKADN